MIRPLIIVALCAGLVAACQERQRAGVPLPESEWSSDRIDALVGASDAESEEELGLTAPLPRRRPEQLAVAVVEPPSDAEPAVDPTLVIEQLVGLDFEDARALLGFPALDEVQPPARVWAYNGSGCVLSIFFYPHVDGSTYRALTYEVKGGDDTAEFRNRCFAELVKERAKEGT